MNIPYKQMTQGLAVILLLACAATALAQTPAAAPTNSPADQAATANQLPKTAEQKPDASIEANRSPSSAGTAPTVNNFNPVSASKPSTASQLANLVGGLALILILIFGLSWFVKRFSQGGFMQNPAIKILASMPLGTRERLMLVAVGDKQILLGVTATQISNLQVFDHPVVTTGDKEPGSDFSQKLMAILQQKNISQSGDSSPHDRQA